MIRSLIKRRKSLKRLDREVFPNKPIKIKVVWKIGDNAPAEYWCDAKNVGDKISKEEYRIAILTKAAGNDFSRAVHEVRHRVQLKYPNVRLFTKEKVKKMNDKKGKRILAYLEKLESFEKLSSREIDAIAIEKIVEYSENPDNLKLASLMLKLGI